MMRRALATVCGLLLWLGAAGAAHARPETRVALVIGNSAYQHTAKLTNPEHDARDVATALTAAGFQVFEAFDVEKRRLDGVLRAWADAIAKADVALFYYAGHGVQVGQQNFLLPVDAKLGRERDLEFEGIKVDFILRQMEIDREGKTSIVILDACRDNPLSRSLASSMGTRSASVGRGLTAAPAGIGTFIAFATQPGNVALDGEAADRNSPFAKALVREMLVKGRTISGTMGAVRRAVIEATNGRQVPWDHSSLTADFYFVPATAPAAVAAPPPTDKEREELAQLRDRLAKLEAETRQQRPSPPAASGPTPATMADAMRLAELRARAANTKDLVDGLQRKLFEARRIESTAKDPTERQKLQRDSTNIQMEMTRRAQDLKKLREEIATLENPGAAAAGAPQFIVRPANRIAGDGLTAPPSTANCESRCQMLQPQCVAWNLSRGGECELLSSYRERQDAADWRSGLRSDIVATPQPTAAAPVPPVIPKPGPPPKVSPDFEERDNVGLMGVEIGDPFRAPSPIACREACTKDAQCVGWQHGKKVGVMGQCQLFSRLDARREDNQWRSGVRTTAPAR